MAKALQGLQALESLELHCSVARSVTSSSEALDLTALQKLKAARFEGCWFAAIHLPPVCAASLSYGGTGFLYDTRRLLGSAWLDLSSIKELFLCCVYAQGEQVARSLQEFKGVFPSLVSLKHLNGSDISTSRSPFIMGRRFPNLKAMRIEAENICAGAPQEPDARV